MRLVGIGKWVILFVFTACILISGIHLNTAIGKSSVNKRGEYMLVELKNPHMLELLKKSGYVKIVHNYGYYLLVKTYDKRAMSLKGLCFHNLDYTVRFQTMNFNGSSNELPSDYRGSYSTHLYLVQFVGPTTVQWLKQVKTLGVRIYRYYPNYSYLVKIKNPIDVSNLKNLWFVRDVVPFQPYWKLYRNILPYIENTSESTVMVKIDLDPHMDINTAASDIAVEYGIRIIKKVYYPKLFISYVVGYISSPMIRHLITSDEVLGVSHYEYMHILNDNAARIIGADLLRDDWRNGLGLSVTGASQVVAIADTGLDTGNISTLLPDFAGRVLTIYDAAGDGDPSDPDCSQFAGHGTHVTGSVAGNGVMSGSNPAKHYYEGSYAGIAPEARIHFESIGYHDSYYGSYYLWYDSITNMSLRSYKDGARVWSNSWGGSDNTYTSESSEVDTFMWTHKDFLIVFAAGNSGPKNNTVGEPATAKDIVTVGACENLVPHVMAQGLSSYMMASNMWDIPYFSSRGPTADGLIKPDVVAPGTGIVSVRPSTLNDSNTEYTWEIPVDSNSDGKYDYGAMQGTSMATPITAGAAVLIRDYLTRVDPDYDPVTHSVNISAALVKAILIGGATSLPGFKYHGIDQGYGRINIARALIPEPPLSYRYWDWQAVSNGANWSRTIEVKTSEAPLRIVLTWTDNSSGTGQGIAVNNLDLRVIAPNGTEYHGEMFKGDSQWSVENPTGYDTLNVTEVVNVKKPAVGTWRIEVIGASIGADDPDVHAPGALDQSFAVYAFGPFGNQSVGTRVKVDKYIEGIEPNSYKNYSDKPIQKVVVRGGVTEARFRVVNWGNVSDTYALNYRVIPSTGDIYVSYSPSVISLSPGKAVWVNATIHVNTTAQPMLYRLRLEAVSSINSSIISSLIINLQVVNTPPVRHTQITYDTIPKIASAIAIDPTDNSLWLAYFRQNISTTGNPVYPKSGNGESYDLVIEHSTDGGSTWQVAEVMTNFTRYYNSSGTLKNLMDWYYWYPVMKVDSGGNVYVAFTNLSTVFVVSGNESGWRVHTFEVCHAAIIGSYEAFDEIYPQLDILTTSPGNAWVFYTFRNASWWYGYTTYISAYRSLKVVHTTDGGFTWSAPYFIGPHSGNYDEEQYYPSAVEYNGKIWLFYSQRNQSAGDTDFYVNYYLYNGTSWSGPYHLYGNGTDNESECYISTYVDRSGKLWVAWYSTGDNQNAHFGVVEHSIYLMYYNGASWSGVIKLNETTIGSDINDYGPIPMGEDDQGNIWVIYLEENSYYTPAPHNLNWTYYRYSIKSVQISSATGAIVGTRYIDYGGTFIMHPSGASFGGTMYISYTKSHEFGYPEIYLAKYNSTLTDDLGPSTYGTLVEPANSNNATKVIYVDLVYVKSLSLSAIVSDVESGNSTIAGAEYFIDAIGASGTGTALYATDGAFDSAVESVNITLDPFSLSRGYHRIYVHGRDANGNWGAYDYIDIYIYASKYRVYGYVYDSSGTPLANIAVNITDTVTGENVTVYTNASGYYEYYIDQFPHAYSIGDKILVYADDGSNPGAIDGTYYDTNTTSVSAAPGAAQLNLYLVSPVPEFSSYTLWFVVLLISLIALFMRKSLPVF